MSGPTWYDVLGIEPTAGADEVRAAWRQALADLDPGDRRAKLATEAAEALLDPDRRVAYDATLAAAPVETSAETRVATTATATAATEPPAEPAAGPTRNDEPATGWVPSGWLLAAVALLAALCVGGTAAVAAQPHHRVIQGDAGTVEADAAEAQAAAERAVGPILSYDYRTMDEDAARARTFLTDSYVEDSYDPLFAVLEENAPKTKTVVGPVDVVDSGIVRVGDGRVQVLVLCNRQRTNAQVTTPDVFQDQLTLTMVETDGEWLVDDITTTPLGD
ncbi:J domain-containing protein [Nocardioides sp. GY 10127]|uniref:J domain-containing protein n=1 Tax=Nocardioides sp. GY 10127 TaxID=2569762 RepID=UPI0010A8EC04|nr:J domain-containing protein [Nocardioides sp. GY 10127]TIC79943.1 J domain-containing protein [Nocardioides sp. GY 10127]